MLKKNLFANYIGSFYTLFIGIFILPLYLNYLGAEAFGLVSFLTLVQSWMNMLDVGITPTLGRTVAVARSKINGFLRFILLLRSLEILFVGLAVCVFLIFFLGKNWVAVQWLTVQTIELSTVSFCIVIIGGVVGLRWVAGLYRSGISGMEQLVWLNSFNIIFSSIKVIAALIYLHFISTNVKGFFILQLIISAAELFLLMYKFYSLLPRGLDCGLKFSWLSLKEILPFAFGIAYTSWLWIVVTQLDKLLLSKILTLGEFGYYSLVVLIAGSIGQLSGPVKSAILPRMTMHLQKSESEKFLNLYITATQFVAVVVFSFAGVVACFSKLLLFSWTGNVSLSEWGADFLPWLVIGNSIFAVESILYHMQFAHGKLKHHAIGSTISGLIQIPLIYFAVINYGAKGAAICWFSFSIFHFIFWTGYIHSIFLPKIHLRWISGLLPILLVSSATSFTLLQIVSISQDRIIAFFQLCLVGITVLTFTGLSSSVLRRKLLNKLLRTHLVKL